MRSRIGKFLVAGGLLAAGGFAYFQIAKKSQSGEIRKEIAHDMMKKFKGTAQEIKAPVGERWAKIQHGNHADTVTHTPRDVNAEHERTETTVFFGNKWEVIDVKQNAACDYNLGSVYEDPLQKSQQKLKQ